MILILLKILLWINFAIFLSGVLIFIIYGRRRIKNMNNGELKETSSSVTTIIPIKGGSKRSIENIKTVLASQPNKDCVVFISIESTEEVIYPELKKLENIYTNLKIIISGDPGLRMGKAHNMFEAYKYVKTDFVAFKDDDVRISKRNYLDLISKLENPKTGGGFAPAFYKSTGKPDKIIEIITNYYFTSELLKFAEQIKLNFCAGAFMMFKKEAIDNSGGIEKILNNIADDASLGKLISSNNYSIVLSDVPVLMESNYLDMESSAKHVKKWMVIVKKFLGTSYYFLPLTFQLSNIFWIVIAMMIFYSVNVNYLVFPGLLIIYKIVSSGYIDRHILKKQFNFFHYITIVIMGIFQSLAWLVSLPPDKIEWSGKKYKIGKGGKILSIKKV